MDIVDREQRNYRTGAQEEETAPPSTHMHTHA